MNLALDPADLKPIVAAVVEEVLVNRPAPSERLAYPEAEAAALLGVAKHVLRDARLRGEVKARLIGSKMCYTPAELRRFAAATT